MVEEFETPDLFAESNDVVSIPTDDSLTVNTSILKSDDIREAIIGDQVKTMILPEELGVEENNYVIDVSNKTTNIYGYQLSAISSFLYPIGSEKGDTAIYLNTNTGLLKLGYGNRCTLENVLVQSISSIFKEEDKIKIYKDMNSNGEATLLEVKDITTIRLGL